MNLRHLRESSAFDRPERLRVAKNVCDILGQVMGHFEIVLTIDLSEEFDSDLLVQGPFSDSTSQLNLT